jgi:hypothetical protein
VPQISRWKQMLNDLTIHYGDRIEAAAPPDTGQMTGSDHY